MWNLVCVELVCVMGDFVGALEATRRLDGRDRLRLIQVLLSEMEVPTATPDGGARESAPEAAEVGTDDVLVIQEDPEDLQWAEGSPSVMQEDLRTSLERSRRRHRSPLRQRSEIRPSLCYQCRRTGHQAADCPDMVRRHRGGPTRSSKHRKPARRH